MAQVPVGRRAGHRAAGLAAQAARQAAAGRLAARHQERLAQLAAQAGVARQVVHPVGGPAQLRVAPLGADPADLSQRVRLEEADQVVTVEVPADQVRLADPVWRGHPVPAYPAEVPDRGLWQVLEARPAVPDLELGARWAQVAQQMAALGEALSASLRQVDWYQAMRQAVADLEPVPPAGLVELERLEEDRCPAGLARAGLAGVLVPRGAERLGLCPCPKCRR